ncbi:DNA translocase FtsK [Candidatus Gracilibacteria bacterium]|nr:DNA translocase FtsK [Candidatus Gracilibacteria bacterium]
MARRKKGGILANIPQDYKTAGFALVFLFLGIITFIGDTQSILGYNLFKYLSKAFGEFYIWIFSPVLIAFSVFLFKEKDLHFNSYRAFGLLFFYVSATTLVGWYDTNYIALFNLYPELENVLGRMPLLFSALILLSASLYILFRYSVLSTALGATALMPSFAELKDSYSKDKKASKLKHESKSVATKAKKLTAEEKKMQKEASTIEKQMEELRKEKEALAKMKQPKQLQLEKQKNRKVAVSGKSNGGKISSLFGGNKDEVVENNSTKKDVPVTNFNNWVFPPLRLLETRKSESKTDQNEIRTKEIEIQEKLLQFGISVEMAGYKVGPTVIQYRLKPQAGVKLQKIVNLKKDLTLALQAKNIRIQAPIPGLGVVGIEVPNDNRETVGLKELIASPEFESKKMEIPMAIGRNVSGKMIFGDLTKMPHLLVAGQTASGKSVGMNGFLISMLYKFSPSELKLIMIDPKRVELSIYNGIPHLLTPVITNPEKAFNSLKWAVAEMLRRYDLATKVNARNLTEYNKKVSKSEKLPYIVIVIDELADLMMSGQKKEVEGSIARIAQMARAVGMHLIVATQRPSVDVITGLIKANIPSRIAFTVASQIDSRTVLDKMGAEDLLGRGDMLYYPTGVMEPERVQGVLVETHEIETVVNQLKLTVDPDLLKNMQDPEIANGKSANAGSILEGYKGDQEEDPEIIERAIAVVKESRKGSTSLIQRKLSLGYARAAKVLDILEELGVVGPANGSKPREVYVD